MMRGYPIPVLIVAGATASGKTALLFDVFCGSSFAVPAEVVCADSMQVYRGMDIGTAKPVLEERARLPHHLIDLCEPSEQFNSGNFVRLAGGRCAEIYSRGRLPVVAGGTAFYIKHFLKGLPEAPVADEAVRRALKEELRKSGSAPLFAELTERDPQSAARIHVNDTYRIVRALEVVRSTGKPLSAFAAESREAEAGQKALYDFLTIEIGRPADELYRRINARVDDFFSLGLEAEVCGLAEKGYTPQDPGLRAIAYREFFSRTIDGDWVLRKDIDAVKEEIKINSRHYAKRQKTFFKKLNMTHRLNAGAQAQAELRKIAAAFWSARRA